MLRDLDSSLHSSMPAVPHDRHPVDLAPDAVSRDCEDSRTLRRWLLGCSNAWTGSSDPPVAWHRASYTVTECSDARFLHSGAALAPLLHLAALS